jgi:hypothetical protein
MGTEYPQNGGLLQTRLASIVFTLIAVLCTTGVPKPARAGASDAVIANSVLLAADDFVINVYHNGH